MPVSQISNDLKAWVNFDGAAATPVIRASKNVSSLIDGGPGKYWVVFTQNMVDTNYCVQVTAASNNAYNKDGAALGCVMMNLTTPEKAVNSVGIMVSIVANGGGYDSAANDVNVSVTR